MTPPEQPDGDEQLRRSLAHDQWCNDMRRAGWRYGDPLDLPGLQHPDLVPYDQLLARHAAEDAGSAADGPPTGSIVGGAP